MVEKSAVNGKESYKQRILALFTLRSAYSKFENGGPTAVLVLGYPSEDGKPLDLHDKTRPMDEVVYYDHF